MEYLGRGDLSRYATSGIPEVEIKEIAEHVLRGLEVMHKEGFTHRDIKPQNILVVQKRPEFQRWWVKIADFGISKQVSTNSDTALLTTVGTRPYCAPEILGHIEQYRETSAYSNKVDMWSFGCVLFNLGSQGQLAFSESDLVRYCDERLQFNSKNLPIYLSDDGKLLIQALLRAKPDLRPSATEALQHSWLAVLEWSGSDSSSKLPPQSHSIAQHNFNSFLDSTLSTHHSPVSNDVEFAMHDVVVATLNPKPSNKSGQNVPARIIHSNNIISKNTGNSPNPLIDLHLGEFTEKQTGVSATDQDVVSTSGLEKMISRQTKPDADADVPRLDSSQSTDVKSPHDEDSELTKWLKENEEKLREGRKDGETPLFLAVAQGRVDIAKLLNRQHADIVARNKYAWNLVHTAAIHGQVEAAKWLVKQKADINATDNERRTPLHKAAQHGQSEFAIWLVEQEANLYAKDRYDENPLLTAAHYGQLEVIKCLSAKGADLKTVDDAGWTLLHVAAENGRLNVAKWLVELGADICARNSIGRTPRDVAKYHGKSEVESWLQELEAAESYSTKVMRWLRR